MKEYTGTCVFCGQQQIVQAENQREADKAAAENCTCDNKLKRTRTTTENINRICGEDAQNFGMEIVAEDITDALIELGRLCVHELITSASVKIPDSTITIKSTKDGISINRKKTLSLKTEA